MATRKVGNERMVALLRGINVGGNRPVPMARLRAVAASLKLGNPTTFIASGNLLFDSSSKPAELEGKLESAIEEEFGFFVDVMVRTRGDWQKLLASNPFPDAAEARANLLHVGLSKRPVAPGAQEALAAIAAAEERVRAAPHCVWIDYANGAGRSKLTPKVLDRAVGSVVTARNWKTATTLAELLAEA